MTAVQPKRMRRIFHIPKGIAYAIQNSFLAVSIAYALGFRWIDVDGLLSKDYVPMALHWKRLRKNGYVLPEWFTDLYGEDPLVEDCLAHHLMQLKSKRVWWRGKWRVTYCRTLEQICRNVARHKGMGVMYEEKDDWRFEFRYVQFNVRKIAENTGLWASRFTVGTLTNLPGARARLRAASAEGHTTVALARGPIPETWEPYIDYVRGKWTRSAA